MVCVDNVFIDDDVMVDSFGEKVCFVCFEVICYFSVVDVKV